MKVAIIAAGGKSGQAVVRELLDRGHSVIAGVHHVLPFAPHERLMVTTLDATVPNSIAGLIGSCDAVISVIGHVKGSPATVQTDATRALIAACRAVGVTRVISLTGSGVRQPGDRITFMDRFLNAGIGVVDPARIKDGLEAAALLASSGMDYTIIRVLKLTSRPKHDYKLTPNGPVQTFTSRATVAAAMCDVLERRSSVRSMPLVSNG